MPSMGASFLPLGCQQQRAVRFIFRGHSNGLLQRTRHASLTRRPPLLFRAHLNSQAAFPQGSNNTNMQRARSVILHRITVGRKKPTSLFHDVTCRVAVSAPGLGAEEVKKGRVAVKGRRKKKKDAAGEEQTSAAASTQNGEQVAGGEKKQPAKRGRKKTEPADTAEETAVSAPSSSAEQSFLVEETQHVSAGSKERGAAASNACSDDGGAKVETQIQSGEGEKKPTVRKGRKKKDDAAANDQSSAQAPEGGGVHPGEGATRLPVERVRKKTEATATGTQELAFQGESGQTVGEGPRRTDLVGTDARVTGAEAAVQSEEAGTSERAKTEPEVGRASHPAREARGVDTRVQWWQRQWSPASSKSRERDSTPAPAPRGSPPLPPSLLPARHVGIHQRQRQEHKHMVRQRQLIILTPEQLRAVTTTSAHVRVMAGPGAGKTRVLVKRAAHLVEHMHIRPPSILCLAFNKEAVQEMKHRIREELSGLPDVWGEVEVKTYHGLCGKLLHVFLPTDKESVQSTQRPVCLSCAGVTTHWKQLGGGGHNLDFISRLPGQFLSSPEAVEEAEKALKREQETLLKALLAWCDQQQQSDGEQWKREMESLVCSPHGRILEMKEQHKSSLEPLSLGGRLLMALLGIDTGLAATMAGPSYSSPSDGSSVASSEREWLMKNFPGRAQGTAPVRIPSQLYSEYHETKRGRNMLDYDDFIVLTVLALRFLPSAFQSQSLLHRVSHVLLDESQDMDYAFYELVRLLVTRGGQLRGSEQRGLFMVGDVNQSINGFRGSDPTYMISQVLVDFAECETIHLRENHRNTPPILEFATSMLRREVRQHMPADTHALLHECLKSSPIKTDGDPVSTFVAPTCRQEAKKVKRIIQGLLGAVDKSAVPELTRLPLLQAAGPLAPRDIAILYRMRALSRSIEVQLMHDGVPFTVVEGFNILSRPEVQSLLLTMRLILNPKDDEALRTAAAGGLLWPPYKREWESIEAFAKDRGCNSLWEALFGPVSPSLAGNADGDSEDAGVIARASLKKLRVRPVVRNGLLQLREAVTSARQLAEAGTHHPGELVEVIAVCLGLKMGSTVVTAGGAESTTIGAVIDVGDTGTGVVGGVLGDQGELWSDGESDGSDTESASEDHKEQKERKQAVRDFVFAAHGIGQRAGPGMEGVHKFLDDHVFAGVENLRDPGKRKSEVRNAVRLMTMHSAKGLEFPAVIMVGMEEGSLPSSKAETSKDIMGEANLCFVACTRALQILILTSAQSRWMIESVREVKDRKESRFCRAMAFQPQQRESMLLQSPTDGG